MTAETIFRRLRNSSRRLALALAAALLLAFPASAQSIDAMLKGCSNVAHDYFRDFNARTDMKYNGQRVDGTHAINGRIFLETRAEDFACSYEPVGQRMVEFFAEGRPGNAYLPKAGGGSGATGGLGSAEVTGIASNDVLNVRSGPGTNYRVVGALSNGTRVRNLGCRTQGGSRWCEIEMMTDMRERGWVNARYLTGAAQATQLPSAVPQAPSEGTTTTERVRFPTGASGTELVGALPPGASKRYVLNARAGQNLYVRVAHRSGPRLDFQVFNPDRTFLLEMIPTDREYRGQLWQSGDHVIEVINRRGNTADYTVIFGIN